MCLGNANKRRKFRNKQFNDISSIIDHLKNKKEEETRRYLHLPCQNESLHYWRMDGSHYKGTSKNRETSAEKGFRQLDMFFRVIHNFGAVLEPYQEKLIKNMISGSLCYIFGDSLPVCVDEIKERYGIDGELETQMSLALTPRQVGKTFCFAIAIAAETLCFEDSSIIYYGNTQHLCQETMRLVQKLFFIGSEYLSKNYEEYPTFKIISNNKESFVVKSSYGETRYFHVKVPNVSKISLDDIYCV